jgi:hypothetical protein
MRLKVCLNSMVLLEQIKVLKAKRKLKGKREDQVLHAK